MMKRTLVTASFALIAAISRAGHMEFVSATLITSSPVLSYNNPPVTVGSSHCSVSGRSFDAFVSASSGLNVGGVNQTILATSAARFKVKWVPDPGDGYPMTAAGSWTVAETNGATWMRGTGTGACNITAQSIPFATDMDEARNWTPTTPAQFYSSGTTYYYGFPYADFGFAWEGTDWVGTADVPINQAIVFFGEWTGSAAQTAVIDTNITLTGVGGYTLP